MDISTETKGAKVGEEYVTREEFNGLGSKVSMLSEQCIGCRTSLNSDVKHLNEELKETKTDMAEIKQRLQKINEQLQALTIRVSIIVAITVGAINIAFPFIKHLLEK